MTNLENCCLKDRECATMLGLLCNASDKDRIEND